MEVNSKQFISLANVAMENETMQTTMELLGIGLSMRRQMARDRLPEFDRLRDEAVEIKNHTLTHLDVYLEQFERQVKARGGHVHWASDEASARQIVLDICDQHGAKSATKSKSMVTEEIGLVPFLETNGIEALETDLGEYIIQLRKERPSHIIAPAIHLNKGQVGETFFEHHKKFGFNEKLTERADMVAEARQVLRDKFLHADVGISGANFLVAETGTTVLVTNEGNAELTTALPDTHIVVTGIEKIVPTMEDACTFVRLLGRSAAGMEISAYTSFITGSRRDHELDGPENFHVVLVDNGRSDMLGTEFQDMLRCIRCSACLNHCPVYLSVGGHAYGSVYNGPMGAVLTPQFASLEEAADLPNASTFCGRCEEVCPVRIPLPRMMREWRNREFEQGLGKPSMRWGMRVWNWLNRMPHLHKLATRVAARLMYRLRGQDDFLERLPGVAGNWTLHRDFRRPTGKTFMEQWQETSK